jgi:SAM-dependent methyltransferase
MADSFDAKQHWETIYQNKAADQVSWYQQQPTVSLSLINRDQRPLHTRIIDVGAGASVLVDHLLGAGYQRPTVLDISSAALQVAQARLGQQASAVDWRVADVLKAGLPSQYYDLWHDRAVFHFLTDPLQQQQYIEVVAEALKPGGEVIVGAFASDGPTHCSGLEVARYDPAQMHDLFGQRFTLLESQTETHRTPWESEQKFTYCRCRFALNS